MPRPVRGCGGSTSRPRSWCSSVTTTSRSRTAACRTTSAVRSRTARACCSRRPRAWPRASRSTCAPDRRWSASTATAKEVEVRDVAAGPNVPGVLRQARAVPRGRADPAADPGCRRPARRRAAQHPRHGPHHRPARRGRHERRRHRWQLHRAGAHRGLPGARAADDRRRADRPADAVAGPRDDPDPRLPRRDPRRGHPARHVGQGDPPRRATAGSCSISPTARRSRPTSS